MGGEHRRGTMRDRKAASQAPAASAAAAKTNPVRVLRREKRGPAEDFWHTLAVGIPVAIVLAIVLPLLI